MSRLAQIVLLVAFGLLANSVNAQVPQINSGGIVNAATFASNIALAPGAIFSVFGTSLSNGTTGSAAATPLPTRLAGSRVLVNGIPAPLFFASPTQINAQFPTGLNSASASLVVEVESMSGTLTSAPVSVPVGAAAPGIFTLNQSGNGPGAILRNADFSEVCPHHRADCVSNAAGTGEVVAIYAAGLGLVNGSYTSGQAAVDPLPTQTGPIVTIGGLQAQVLYSGLAVGFVGLYQVNVMIPADSLTGDFVPMTLSIAGIRSNTVTIAIAPPPCQVGTALPFATIHAIAVDPLNPLRVYTGADRNGVYASCDGGKTWDYAGEGVIGASPLALAIDPTNPRNIYTVTSYGFSKSSNQAQSWTSTTSSGLPFSSSFTSIAMDPLNPSTLYIADSFYGVFKSLDAGNSWTVSKFGLTNTSVQGVVVDPRNPLNLYAVEPEIIFKSSDGGQTWNSLPNTGLPTLLTFSVLTIDPLNTNTIYVGTDSGVYKSTNSGQDWTAVNTGLVASPNGTGTSLPSVQALLIDPSNPSTIYVGTSTDGVFKSTNGGQTWMAVNSGLTTPNIEVLVMDPTNSSTIFAGTDSGVFITANAGQNWKPSGAQ